MKELLKKAVRLLIISNLPKGKLLSRKNKERLNNKNLPEKIACSCRFLGGLKSLGLNSRPKCIQNII